MRVQRIFVSQASSDIGQDKKAHLQIPGCSNKVKEDILTSIFNEIPTGGEKVSPDIRKVFAGVFRLLVIPFILFIAIGWYYTGIFDYLSVVPFYMLLAAVTIYFGFKHSALFAMHGQVMVTQGIWDISTAYLRVENINGITTRQYPWHKRANIGHVAINTAGGSLSFKFGNFTRIQELVNLWLYEIESGNESPILPENRQHPFSS